MEAIRGFWRGRCKPIIGAAYEGCIAFIKESIFRVRLSWLVIRGGLPLWTEYRLWNKSHDRPAFLDVYDLATDQLLFTVIVWPDLRADRNYSQVLQHARAQRIFKLFQEVAPHLAPATTWEADFYPVWNRRREVWVREDESAYQGPDLPELEEGEVR